MSINNELFKDFKNPDQSGKQHSREINRFLKDDEHNVLNLTSMQGSGKTTSIIGQFAKSKDAIILTQSNQKIDEIIKIIRNLYPDLQFKAIYGLERSCRTYRSDDEIKKVVAHYRHLGILTEDIHKIICHDKECEFLTQDTDMEGRIIESVARFEAQITMGRAFRYMHWNRLILIDEADGLLNQSKTSIIEMPYQSERMFIEKPTYMPEIYVIKPPEEALANMMEEYYELIKDINHNEHLIKNRTDIIRLLTQGFYSLENKTISELPPIFYIFRSILDRQMKLILGSATMRNHSINNQTLKGYYEIAYQLALEKAQNNIEEKADDEKKLIKKLEHYQFLSNLKPEIREFEANYIPGLRNIYVMDGLIKRHSYSLAYFKRAFDPEDEERRKKAWNQLRWEISMALKFYELEYGKTANKVLLISFKPVVDEISNHIKRLEKNRNLSKDPILKRITPKPFFSNSMHGINANKDGYDLILTIGDPVDHSTSKMAKDLNIFKGTKRGFGIKENTDISLKKQIIRTQSSELIEAFHRGRSEIPIIAIGNFLRDENIENQRIINEIMMENGFILMNVANYLNRLKQNKEYQAFLSSVFKEINSEIK